MNKPKIPLLSILFAIAVVVLIAIGLIWKFNLFAVKPADTTSDFLTYVDHGFEDKDRVELEQKIFDLENSLAADEALAKDLSQWLRLGNLKYQLGDLAGAKEIYETKILKDHPSDAAALENLGQTLYEMQDYAGAELKWRAAISVNPWEVTYLKLTNLIEEHFPARTSEIQEILEEAIANIGQTPGLLKNLGMWFENDGQYDLALDHYKVAKQLAPDDEGINELIAGVREKMR
jgi:tetratricopeptide (TPR) repeat protein